MRVAVIGLGKIGLPLALQCAGAGTVVSGVDIDPGVVRSVNGGVAPFPGEPGLADRLASAVGSGALVATADTARAVAGSAVVVVVVPLVVDALGRPDFAGIDAATAEVGASLRPGTLVVYETTLPVGTTRDRFGPILERASGLVMGAGFQLAFSPERVSSGRVFADLRTYPKLVGGVDPGSGGRAVEFYSTVLSSEADDGEITAPVVQELANAETAEFAKLAETTYRDVNIGLANQFARHAEQLGIDYAAVVDACNSQPFSHLHTAGIAVGGHCIPVYPQFYLSTDPAASIVRAARAVNASMPGHAVARLASRYGDLAGARVGVLGIAYRGGVKESAFSGVFAVVDALREAGATVVVHDPLYTDEEVRSLGFEPYSLGTPLDAAVIQADHAEYARLTAAELPGVQAVLDGRNVLDASSWDDKILVALGRA